MKVAINVPMYRSTSAPCISIIQQAVNATAMAGHQVANNWYANALVDAGRNLCLAMYGTNCDFCVFIDDDMKPEEQAVNKIVALNAPVASALLTTRQEPVELVVRCWNEKLHGFSHVEHFRTDKPSTGQFGVGAAFLCLRRDTIEALMEYYLTAKDWIEGDKALHERLKVQPYKLEQERARKEAERRELFATENYLRVFDRDFLGGERRVSEDLTLSTKLIQLGIPVTIDPTIYVTHTGEKDFGWRDYVPPSVRGIFAA